VDNILGEGSGMLRPTCLLLKNQGKEIRARKDISRVADDYEVNKEKRRNIDVLVVGG